MTRTKSTAFLALLVAAGLAGCQAGAATGSGTPSASPSASGQHLLALGQEWVRCMRDQGLPRMPDAQLSEEGYLSFPPADGYNWKDDAVKRPDVIEACKPIEDRYPPNAFRPRQQLTADDLRKLGEYADCLRTHGIPAWPDPDSDGVFDLSDTPLADGVPGNLMDSANDACRSVWSGEVNVRDNSGGGKK
ncbi:hypothetical protein [Asanoa siamensis]|uniref:Lipoprotein n=1 Tax=Asanoa siamensis TaxID=926357 RepID=A0ABQ4CYR8_9ACTN|nr:hypothetical protein [Asanoa siamensis]GIF76438.1 hypothetical protein Asi02nite_59560 [Asanoa siamensis]